MRRHLLVIVTAVIAAAFVLGGRVTPRAALRSVDYDLLLILFALLVTVEILRASGLLDRIVAGTVARFDRTRSLAFALVALAGVLACLITNDVALFVVIPFTVIAGRMTDFDVEDVVILEIVATNLIGCLTPLGNPQNLFVYHQSGWSAVKFVSVMAPFVAFCAVGLAVSVLLVPPRAFKRGQAGLPVLHRRAAMIGLVCFAFVVLDIARLIDSWIPAVVALIAGAFVLRRRFLRVDLSIVPLFFFAFIAVAGLSTFSGAQLTENGVYAASIVISQFISNVPATVLLAPFSGGEWRELLYGVSAGGCGTIIASLANLLGWRIYVRESNRDPRFFRRLTVLNFLFLAWAATGGWLFLRT